MTTSIFAHSAYSQDSSDSQQSENIEFIIPIDIIFPDSDYDEVFDLDTLNSTKIPYRVDENGDIFFSVRGANAYSFIIYKEGIQLKNAIVRISKYVDEVHSQTVKERDYLRENAFTLAVKNRNCTYLLDVVEDCKNNRNITFSKEAIKLISTFLYDSYRIEYSVRANNGSYLYPLDDIVETTYISLDSKMLVAYKSVNKLENRENNQYIEFNIQVKTIQEVNNMKLYTIEEFYFNTLEATKKMFAGHLVPRIRFDDKLTELQEARRDKYLELNYKKSRKCKKVKRERDEYKKAKKELGVKWKAELNRRHAKRVEQQLKDY